AVVVHDENLYLALVATRPSEQRKGYGEAVVRHALQSAYEATGLSRTILHASDAGMPVYRRVGYHKTASILAYKLAGGSESLLGSNTRSLHSADHRVPR